MGAPHRPKHPAWFGAKPSDEELCGMLDRAALSVEERRALTFAMARFVEIGFLPRTERSQLLLIARGLGLLAPQPAPKKPKAAPSTYEGGDCFSARPGKVDPRAAAQVPWLGGRMPAPVRRSA